MLSVWEKLKFKIFFREIPRKSRREIVKNCVWFPLFYNLWAKISQLLCLLGLYDLQMKQFIYFFGKKQDSSYILGHRSFFGK